MPPTKSSCTWKDPAPQDDDSLSECPWAPTEGCDPTSCVAGELARARDSLAEAFTLTGRMRATLFAEATSGLLPKEPPPSILTQSQMVAELLAGLVNDLRSLSGRLGV